MRKVKISLIVMILIMIVVVSSFPLAGVAYALCSGSACNGTDPQLTGCSADAATVKTKYPPSGLARVELRFSDACQTRWSKVINIAALNYWANATLRYWYYKSVYLGPGYTAYSFQRYGSGYRACGDVGPTQMNYLINDLPRCTGAY
ncbi:MAG: hypothetical protein CNIPEHKO_01235 [Anaerolineales bacterium]|nr:hypothetical protein [Anaerolineales bacterium]